MADSDRCATESPARGSEPETGGGSKPPKVSVCVLTYNHQHLVEDTLRTILAQTYTDFELIVSDDRSTDGTFAVLQRMAASDPRLRIVQPPRNLGMAGNANFAVAQARGQYVALLHHDDVYLPRLIEAWTAVLDRNPTAGFVSNAYRDHDRGHVFLHPFNERNLGSRVLRENILPVWGSPIRGTAMVRKRCWDAVSGMREEFGMLADVDLWMRLASRYDLGYVPEPLIVVRQDRPEYYPEAYWGWSWPRLKLGYDIYGTHHESFYGRATLHGRARQALYRARVNVDILKWLGYGIVKRRKEVLATSDQVENRYEYRPVALTRKLLQRLAALVERAR